MVDESVPVLIAGGSLVGLSTSLLLSYHGIPNMVVERHEGTAIHPRAASFHQRTMEIFRSAGVQDSVETAAQNEFEQHGAIVAVESVSGEELQYFSRSWSAGVEDLSPTMRLFVTQVGLEPVLRRHAQLLGAQHHYGTELVSFEEDEGGVTCLVRPRDGDTEWTVRSQYLVAADGARSPIRQRLGIATQGRGTFANCATIYFKADIRPMIGDRNLSVVYVRHPQLLGFFRFSITGDAGFLAVFATIDEDGARHSPMEGGLTNERCVEMVRTALGCSADTPIEIENVQEWEAEAVSAERFSAGRVFLAGDAAHAMPPTGGFGGNVGVADAHNLAWKLAMVLGGSAGAELLDSYDLERRPASRMTVEQAYTRYVQRVDPTLDQRDLAPTLDDASIELGAVYRSPAVLATDDRRDGAEVEDPRDPTGEPGVRVAHVPIHRNGTTASIHDLFGRRFVLLAGHEGQDWCTAAGDSAASGLPIDAYRLGTGGVLATAGASPESSLRLEPSGAVIVRPDGVLAWRSPGTMDGHRSMIDDAMSRLLAR